MEADLPSFDDVAKAYEPLIKKYIKKWHLIYDYDEMYQVGLIALWEAYLKFDPEKGAFPSFAESYIKGRFRQTIEKQKKYAERTVFAETILLTAKEEENQIEGLDYNEELDEYLLNLTDRERFWVEQAVIHDRSTQDIASKAGVSPHTVRSWKKAALKKLRGSGSSACHHPKNIEKYCFTEIEHLIE